MWGRHPRRWLAPYAEGLLPTGHASQVAGHVFGCARCRRALELVRAGESLAARLGGSAAARPDGAGAPSWIDLAPLLDRKGGSTPRSAPSLSPRWAMAAAATVVLALGAVAWRASGARADLGLTLETVAVAAHRSPALELRSGDEQVVQRWLARHAGLDFPPPGDRGERHLLGAQRLPGGAVALAYQLGNAPVTLVIAPTARSQNRQEDPKEIARLARGALEVARWTRGDRSYALVSALPGQAACSICHADGGPGAVL
jgi:hypothetical protein